MKRTYWLLFFFAIMMSCAPPSLIVKRYPAPGERLRVAVLPFQDAPGRAGSGKIATDVFSTEILRVTAYNVIDRGALEQVLNEQKLAASGAIDQTKAVEVGKLLGADGIIVEVHPDPAHAISDGRQSLTPENCSERTASLSARSRNSCHASFSCFHPPR